MTAQTFLWKFSLTIQMKKYLKNLSYILRHKWFVFLECYKEKIIWRGITHDLSKFLSSEFFAYAEFFYGKHKHRVEFYQGGEDIEFDKAWLKHIYKNPHHWQFWILREDEGRTKILEMPIKYRKEMLCDWRGAAKSQFGKDNTKEWYYKHKDKMRLAPKTREWIEKKLKKRNQAEKL